MALQELSLFWEVLGPLLFLQLWAYVRTRMGHNMQNSNEVYCALDFLEMCSLPSGSKTPEVSWEELVPEDLMYFTGINSNRNFQILLFHLESHLWLLQVVSKPPVTLEQNFVSLLALNKQNCQYVLGLRDTFFWLLGTENKYEISSLPKQFVHPEQH